MRAHLWPASPQRPHIAFTFDLLDWAEALLLECQVAMKDLCKALYFRSPHLVVKVCTVFIFLYVCGLLMCNVQRKDLYSSLVDAFEEYR